MLRVRLKLSHLRSLQQDRFGGATGNQHLLEYYARQVQKGKHGAGFYDTAIKRGDATDNAINKRAGLTVANELDPQLRQAEDYTKGVNKDLRRVTKASGPAIPTS
jgi:hypothetical protein